MRPFSFSCGAFLWFGIAKIWYLEYTPPFYSFLCFSLSFVGEMRCFSDLWEFSYICGEKGFQFDSVSTCKQAKKF